MLELEIRKLLAADQEAAIGKIYDYLGEELFYYMSGMTGSSHDAEELLNELFIKIVDNRFKIAKSKYLKSYLYKMAGNIARDRIRQNRKRIKVLEDFSLFIKLSENTEIDEEKTTEALAALELLPHKQKEVVIMKIFMQKTFNQIGKDLRISENTATSRYHYAMKKMKKKMGANHE